MSLVLVNNFRERICFFLCRLHVDGWLWQAVASCIVIELLIWLICDLNQWMKKSHWVIYAAHFYFCLNETDNLIEGIINILDKFSMVLVSWLLVVIMRGGEKNERRLDAPLLSIFYLYYYINLNWVQHYSFIYF